MVILLPLYSMHLSNNLINVAFSKLDLGRGAIDASNVATFTSIHLFPACGWGMDVNLGDEIRAAVAAPPAGIQATRRRSRIGGEDSGGRLVYFLEEENMGSFTGIAGGQPGVEHVERRRPRHLQPRLERLDGVLHMAPRHYSLVYVHRIAP